MPPPSPPARIKPPALSPGDKIGIVAPASNLRRDSLEAGCESFRNLGFQPFYFDSILNQDIYFAGSLDRRTKELEEMFERPDIRAIVCARGGYGANYLLQTINLEKIKMHPKIFVGYSDITSLLTYFADAANMITFHGPMITKDFAGPDGVDLNSWKAALEGSSEWRLEVNPEIHPLVEGSAEGILFGGCLSILVASLGTPYEIQTSGKILFLEDIAAKPFQIDRMLMQLKLAGKLNDIRGIIFGEMLDCRQNPLSTIDQGYTLESVILRVVGDLGVPIAFGLRSGHVSGRNITLPIGVRTRLSVSAGKVEIEILESATTLSR